MKDLGNSLSDRIKDSDEPLTFARMDTMMKSAVEEERRVKDRQAMLETVDAEILKLLVSNEVTWGEFQVMIDRYSNRTLSVLNSLEIGNIQSLFERPKKL